jgi:hypothetical protein
MIKAKTILRKCAGCGQEIKITVTPDHKYKGANYFGEVKAEGKLVEYWECEQCFKSK